MYQNPRRVVVLVIMFLGIPVIGSLILVSSTSTSAAMSGNPTYVLRVMIKTPADVRQLTSGGWDVLESRGKDYLLVIGNDQIVAALRAQGFTVRIDQVLAPPSPQNVFVYDGGYHTVAEQYAHMDSIAAAHPDLAVTIDYGDSWRKVQGMTDGNDLMAICITKRRPGDCALNPETDKPRFFLMAAIHARELTTSELAWRWMDLLVDNYNLDPDITALLDYNELWVVPVANPDGRQIVEQGGNNPYLQRKNANNSLGDCSDPPTESNQYGVDLNRNADFKWGPIGTSTDPCSQVYNGVAPASEPEEVALQNLLQHLFRDQRGPSDTDVAPPTTTGTMITLHSYANLVLLPWGWTECSGNPCPPDLRAPNDSGLRSFAFRMSYFNGYETGQGSEVLYATSGTTDDWSYGTLGIPAFTFEIGPNYGPCSGFTPSYNCQDSLFWPLNRDAFLYAAKAARQPYVSTLGPTTSALTVNPSHTPYGVPIMLTASISDAPYGNSGAGRPDVQRISQAEYYIDLPPWAGGNPLSMEPRDGAFDNSTELVVARVNTQLSIGRHTLFVRGRDADGNWGAVTAQWIVVDDSNTPPTATPKVTLHFPLVNR